MLVKNNIYLITSGSRKNKCMVASVIILLSNRTLTPLKRPVYAGSQIFLSLCNPFWHFFCKSVWHFTIFPKPLPESDSHMHHTHAPSENENFPSAKPPARTSFLSFFPSHFRSSFRHFCHVLCDFYFSFQVPKPPVFAAFRLFQGYPDADSFSFFKTKNLISGGIPWNKVSGGFMVFLISFFCLSFCLTYALFLYFPASPLHFGCRKSSKEIA